MGSLVCVGGCLVLQIPALLKLYVDIEYTGRHAQVRVVVSSVEVVVMVGREVKQEVGIDPLLLVPF
jgi:hypothetical protein